MWNGKDIQSPKWHGNPNQLSPMTETCSNYTKINTSSDMKRISSYWTIKNKEIQNKNSDTYITRQEWPSNPHWNQPFSRWTTALPTQSSSMANNTETVAVKTEFIDVITEGELLSSPISTTFSTIITEASLVEVPPAKGPINKKTITTLYNEVFVDAMSYRTFIKNKLRPWENALEYKHLDTMYTNHWSLVNTIRKLCQQAQAFLQLLYWSQPLLQPLNSFTPLLFWQNIPSGIRSMPISSFWYEESYMVYIGDISKIHHSFKKSSPMGKSSSSDSSHDTPYHSTSLKTTSLITFLSFYTVDPSNLTT